MDRARREWTEFVHYRHAYALAASASLGSIFYGWDIGLIGGVLSMASFQQYFGLDTKSQKARDDLSGNIVSVLQAGCFFGALFTGWVAGRFGRKPSLIGAGLVYLIGSLIQCVVGIGMSQKTGLSLLYFSRFLGGWGVGMVSALVPTYVSECVPKAIRGRCTGMVQLSNNLGIMLAFWVNYSASKDIAKGELQWRIPFIMQMVPGVFFVLAMVRQPESPRWLTEHGHTERAAAALAFAAGARADDVAVRATLAEMQAAYAGKPSLSLWQQMRMMGESRATAYRCFVASLVMFFQQWTGTNAINYYSPTIFKSLGVTGQNAGLFATGIYGVVKVISVATVLAVAVEGFGRKNCLIVGGLVQAVTMLWIAGYTAIHKAGGGTDGAGYVSIICVYLYAVGYCIGWGPVPWVVASEVTPNHVRTAAMAVAIGVNWLFSFTISKITPTLLTDIGYGTFLLFGLCCVAMAAWAYAGLPETAGVALEDVRYLFEKDVLRRALQDAPGGRVFLAGKTVPTVEQLREADAAADVPPTNTSRSSDEDVKRTSVEVRESPSTRPQTV